MKIAGMCEVVRGFEAAGCEQEPELQGGCLWLGKTTYWQAYCHVPVLVFKDDGGGGGARW